MVFTSISFGIFFPIAVIIYFILPSDKKRLRLLWLLIASYYFYMCGGPEYAALLMLSTIITYVGALFLRGRKAVFFLTLILNFAILFFFKYFNFFCDSFGIDSGIKILLPVGISFYIFKSASYLIDVYRGAYEPERDLIRYALYVSFFPEILSGPISRAPEVLPQFDEVHTFDYERIRDGLFRMLWGYFLKLVIVARLSILVDLVFDNYSSANACQLLIGALVFPINIYCDFMSYSEIAIGAGKIMGIELSENFRQPFLARSLSEVWRRWHMSLMSWFKDYLYIPLGGSRKGIVRKYLNILIVFTVSGLWHGAAFTYVLWGFLSGLLQVIGEITAGVRKKVLSLVPVKGSIAVGIHLVYSRIMTFLLFSFTAVFFRSPDIPTAFTIISKIFTGLTPAVVMSTDVRELGLGTLNLCIAVFMVLVLLIAGILKERSNDTILFVTKKAWYVRWAVYFFLVSTILLSANIGASKFIYFDF